MKNITQTYLGQSLSILFSYIAVITAGLMVPLEKTPLSSVPFVLAVLGSFCLITYYGFVLKLRFWQWGLMWTQYRINGRRARLVSICDYAVLAVIVGFFVVAK